ncbi:ATP-binding cassette domain-containing protein [Planococcus sp. ISL-109]|uniref:ATP-binding cassette domain-containing protein n=1 Tax=Planococcus sp. ISL-109 TaxID=2819166 RepID=UPI003335FD31
MTLLSVNNLSVQTGGHSLVTDVSFDIQKGEWLAIIGQSGSGKSSRRQQSGGCSPRT